mmetsp:Transcript_20057/g.56856  ORF Transcript_20057/g.56856 Transcript_20057/m.56856 type:complete len:275 (+) Transcript_20057:571-1395(+)
MLTKSWWRPALASPPALSVIRAQKHSRRINLIWMVRAKDLFMFFLQHHLLLDHSEGWNLIFYTGREDLPDDIIEVYSNTNVNIIRGRPKLSEVIPNIIYSIESGKGLPERYKPDEEIGITEQLVDMLDNTNKSECLNDDNDEYDAENRYNENDDDDDASITTQQLNDVKKETAKNLGFELDGIEKSGLSADPNIRCPKEHRNRRSTAIMENLNLGFTPWDEHPESIPFVKTLSRKFVLKTWGLLYCGGARVVEKDLRKLSHELKIDLHVESFGW